MNIQDQKQRLIWGGLLILFGLAWLLDYYMEISSWSWVAILVIAGLASFIVYLTDLSNFSYLIPAYVFMMIALLITLIELRILGDESIAVFVLLAVALPFLAGYVRKRTEWGLLIPSYVLIAVAAMIYLIGRRTLNDEYIAVYVLSAIALPFIIGFLRTREKGLLIPPYVLIAIAGMLALISAGILNDLLIPAYIMFAIALPFLLVFALNPSNWWALIPGGIMAVIGISFLIAETAAQYLTPVILILAGLWILVRQFFGRKMTATPDLPDDEPPAR